MKKILIYFSVIFLFTFNVFAKSLDQKKDELKKIYEAGGITKAEYEKAVEFLEKPKEKKTKKKSLSLVKKKEKKNPFKKKDKDEDKEEITLEKIEELGKPKKLDASYYPEGMTKKFKGCNNSFGCRGKKAGGELFRVFNGSKSYQQKNPGQMIKAMAMFEIFYASKLWSSRKAIERYKENNYKEGILSKKKEDEEEIRSLFGINKGKNSMRAALGMNPDTPTKEAIKKFWMLGEFLDLGTAVKHDKLAKDLKERQKLLEDYKFKIADLKKKLEDETEEEENEKSVE